MNGFGVGVFTLVRDCGKSCFQDIPSLSSNLLLRNTLLGNSLSCNIFLRGRLLDNSRFLVLFLSIVFLPSFTSLHLSWDQDSGTNEILPVSVVISMYLLNMVLEGFSGTFAAGCLLESVELSGGAFGAPVPSVFLDSCWSSMVSVSISRRRQGQKGDNNLRFDVFGSDVVRALALFVCAIDESDCEAESESKSESDDVSDC